MLICRKNNLLRASQFLAHSGYWDIFTTCSLHRSGKVNIAITLRIPFGRIRTHYPSRRTRDIVLCNILFPSLDHLESYGKLLVKFSRNLRVGRTN